MDSVQSSCVSVGEYGCSLGIGIKILVRVATDGITELSGVAVNPHSYLVAGFDAFLAR